MLSKLQIINFALVALNKLPVASLDSDPLAKQCGFLYDYLLPIELGIGFWRFACALEALNQLPDPPGDGKIWRSQYQLPSDFARLVRIVPDTYAYTIFKNKKIYANFSGTFWIEYVSTNVLDVDLPPEFCKFLSLDIAMWAAAGVLMNAQLAGWLQAQRDQAKTIALSIDSQNVPNTPLRSAPMITKRMGMMGRGGDFFPGASG